MMLCVKVLLLSILVGVSVGQVFDGMGSLYLSAHGPNWHNHSGWMESLDVCQWHGVECAKPSVPQNISLPSNNLVGHMEDDFFSKASTLTQIDFSNNSLSGTISSSIGLAKNLKRIDLSSNSLTGTLPFELSFTPISILIGNHNKFSGVLPHWICTTGAYFSFTGVTFDCPHPVCCDIFDCGNPCNPTATSQEAIREENYKQRAPSLLLPSPSPSLSPSPTPPSPSPTPCIVSLSSSSVGVNPSVPLFFTASSDCGEGRYVWSYEERLSAGSEPFDGGFLCNGTNPKARCSGGSIEVKPNALAFNTTVEIMVQFISTSQNDPSASLTLSFPINEIPTFLTAWTNWDLTVVTMEASFQNLNSFETVSYFFSCDPPSANGCPPCPAIFPAGGPRPHGGTLPYQTSDPALIVAFSTEDFGDIVCEYNLYVEITYDTDEYSYTSQAMTSMSLSENIRLVQLDLGPSTCGVVSSGNGIYFALLGVTANIEELGIVWRQIQGNAVVTCPDNNNCGGNGTSFLFFPYESLNACVLYEWEVIVTYREGEVVVPLCSAEVPGAPQGGSCSAMLGSSGCASPLQIVTLNCSDWVVPCGSSPSIEYQFFTVSEATEALIPAETGPFSGQIKMPFQNTTYVTRICNQGACTRGELEISVCEETNQEEKINEGLREVERELERDDLEGALQTMVVLGDVELGCDDVQSLSALIQQYIQASLNSVDENAANLPDTTTLMQLLGVVAEKNCEITDDLFNSLSQICSAPTNPAVQTFALDFLLENLLKQTDEDERADLIYKAISINECMQPVTTEDTCAVFNPSAYSGDSFFYSQYVVPVSMLRSGFSLDAPGTTIFFPDRFFWEVEYFYKKMTRDYIVRYSCLVISIFETNAILETDVSTDSGIFGANFYVHANGSTSPLALTGHLTYRLIIRFEKKQREGRKQIVDESNCGQYLEGRVLSSYHCTTINQTDTFVYCSCHHFSTYNFGLFPSTDSDSASSALLPSVIVALFVAILAHLF